MCRSIAVCLLSICFGVFLCPAIGKSEPPVIAAAPSVEQQNCEVQSDDCPEMSSTAADCCHEAGHGSQPMQQCCPGPCSLLVLIYNAIDQQRAPRLAVTTINSPDRTATSRTDRPPVPPPRV